ncbi:hypothetical protein BD324DRAFT_615672 [Kockovaella imperatae]|uniref:Ion transport domain-containing protein n=1 Tax=Kockovaella imperatae TaxID=4999 RepID=A0A1Y1UQV3_9TREE|nr:hypothetical protein BD324DRAFT_615672 [Kockovaella imperatae]ORX39957.1 hypothetical protein BD324DRAFT_615672 [Kockovaella imperatae]
MGETSIRRDDRVTEETTVFGLIHELQETITQSIDTALSWDQLNSPPINYTLVRPLVHRLVHGSHELTEDDAGLSVNNPITGEGFKRPLASQLLSVSRADGEESGKSATGKSRSVHRDLVPPGRNLFALMTNRLQFLNLCAADLSAAPLQSSRANFCELLAMKILRATFHDGEEAEYVGELVMAFSAFDGAPSEVIKSLGDEKVELEHVKTSALELAIVSKAKHFLSQSLIQHLMNEIYHGNLVYSPHNSSKLIDDSYVSERNRDRRSQSASRSPRFGPSASPTRPGHTPITDQASGPVLEELAEVYIYDPHRAGWLDHHRLRVPKWRKWLEVLEFAILLALFVTTLAFKRLDRPNVVEIVNFVYTLGFMLDEFAASKEHGWTVYLANAWNAFDMTYIAIFVMYLALRIFALVSHSPQSSELAFDILAIGACVLFPRLMFFLIKDNVVILALKAMIARFIGFMALVIVAFSGICFCLWTLGRGTWTVKQITWLMLQIWFGSSYLGFSASESFHPLFGPIILISYAALCNTLLITILISILSNQFAEINANAQEEHLYQRVVKTVEGVKSDFVFSYLPPINLVAFVLLAPLSRICKPRTLHRINVFAIRCTSFPILMAISGYERWSYRSKRIHLYGGIDHSHSPGFLDTFLGPSSEAQLLSVFECLPPKSYARSRSPGAPETSTARPPQPRVDGSIIQESPLARLFGHFPSFVDSGGGSSDAKGRNETSHNLKDEIEQVRESQLRIEELLAKFVSSTNGQS